MATTTQAASELKSDPPVGCADLLGIGSTVWMFDQNRRIYKDNRSGPIYREYWRPIKITSETTRSWITERGNKIPKKGEHNGYCFTEQEVNDKSWVEDNRYKIAEAVNWMRDVETLRAVAKLAGYEMPNAVLNSY